MTLIRAVTGSGTGAPGGPDGRAQSETIGVILLVTLVVVLAAAVGQFVFGLDIVQSGDQAVGPQISFEKTVEGNDLTLRHGSGDAPEFDTLTVVSSVDGTLSVDWNVVDGDGNGKWGAGEALTLVDLEDGETLRIIWESSTTDDSTVVLRYEFGS